MAFLAYFALPSSLLCREPKAACTERFRVLNFVPGYTVSTVSGTMGSGGGTLAADSVCGCVCVCICVCVCVCVDVCVVCVCVCVVLVCGVCV